AQLSRLSQRVVTSKVNFCWVAWCGCRAVAQGCFRLVDGPQPTAELVEPSDTAVREGGNQP
uniref:hypothetical protein n=1 Tax=Actinoplanes rectilineatus TaxID=113571 RepID=UPI001B807A06